MNFNFHHPSFDSTIVESLLLQISFSYQTSGSFSLPVPWPSSLFVIAPGTHLEDAVNGRHARVGVEMAPLVDLALKCQNHHRRHQEEVVMQQLQESCDFVNNVTNEDVFSALYITTSI